MLELLNEYPWLIIPCLVLLIPICGCVFGILTNHRLQMRKAELHASLIQEMLQRGMSAEEIRTILEASPGKNAKKNCASAGVAESRWPVQS